MNITELPFFFKTHSDRANGGLPQTMPIEIFYDAEFNMYRQKSYPELDQLLEEVYESGTLVEGSLSNESGKTYLEKILAFIRENIKVEGAQVLEIGCGDGTVLIELKNLGANVLGIEPGKHKPHKDLGNIQIIHDFFPSGQVDKKFDLIFNYGVLEHIEKVDGFLSSIKNALTENGKAIICVPNCEEFLKEGDISIFVHQHFNYFTRESLVKLVEKYKLFVEKVAVTEGVLVALIGKVKTEDGKLDYHFEVAAFEKKVNEFEEKLKAEMAKFPQEDIALYVPMRGLNTLYKLGCRDIRLIDDSSQIHKTYLPYFKNAIENFEDLQAHPPKSLIIFSRTFGEKIKAKCLQATALANTEIKTLNEIG